jgi:hypothetical protein
MKRTWAISHCENFRPYVSPQFILLIVSLRSFIRHMGGSVPQVIDVMSSISCYGVGSLVGLLTQNKLFASFCPDVPTRCTQSDFRKFCSQKKKKEKRKKDENYISRIPVTRSVD